MVDYDDYDHRTVNSRFIMATLDCSYQQFCRLKKGDPDFPKSKWRAADGWRYPLIDVVQYAIKKGVARELARVRK